MHTTKWRRRTRRERVYEAEVLEDTGVDAESMGAQLCATQFSSTVNGAGGDEETAADLVNTDSQLSAQELDFAPNAGGHSEHLEVPDNTESQLRAEPARCVHSADDSTDSARVAAESSSPVAPVRAKAGENDASAKRARPELAPVRVRCSDAEAEGSAELATPQAQLTPPRTPDMATPGAAPIPAHEGLSAMTRHASPFGATTHTGAMPWLQGGKRSFRRTLFQLEA